MVDPRDDNGSSEPPELPEALEERLYAVYFDAPADARRAAVQRLCDEHPAFRDALLAHVAAISIGDEAIGLVRQPLTSERLPDRIGPFQIDALLGEGGFGRVFRARQTSPVTRTVALKVLHGHRIDERSQLRFELERRTLARMQHPGIAQFYDAGNADGVHYFAMEFVEGQPITDWCDAQRLGIHARLTLLLKVTAAVHHAHQRGVVHRDLKPQNVLVVAIDGQPAPKVIDFGVAKLLLDDGADQLVTREGAMIGTPAYMSPEQAAGDPVDTRTDVYALGVLLYELLAGDLPFARRRLASGNVAELVRMIQEDEPRSLRRAISDSSTGNSEVAARRSLAEPVLRRRLASDLEWIVRRALQKKPDNRYVSVAALADDVRHYLRSEPVDAREPAAWYLTRRFVARHKLGVTIALATTVMVAATIFVLVRTLGEVESSRRQAVAAGDAAVLNAYAAHLAAARSALTSGDSTAAVRHLRQCAERHRGWEWRYLAAQCHTAQSTHVIDTDAALQSVHWLDDERFVVAHGDGRIEIRHVEGDVLRRFRFESVWNTALHRATGRLAVNTRRRLLVLDLTLGIVRVLDRDQRRTGGLVRSMLFARDGRSLLASSSDGRIWRHATVGPRRSSMLRKLTRFADDMQWLDGGRRLVAARLCGFEILSAADGSPIQTVELGPEEIGRMIATDDAIYISWGRYLEKRDARTGERLQVRNINTDVSTMELSADGKLLYYGQGWFRSAISVRHTDTLEMAHHLHGHQVGVRALQISPDGTRLMSCSRRDTIKIWATERDRQAVELDAGYDVRQLAFARDGGAFATAGRDGRVTLWDAATLAIEHRLECGQAFYGCALTADELFVAGEFLGALDRRSGELRKAELDEHLGNICLDRSERLLVAVTNDRRRLRVYRSSDLSLLHDLEGWFQSVHGIALDHRTGSFAIVGQNQLHWFDAERGRLTETIDLPGAWIVTGSSDGVFVGLDEMQLWRPGDPRPRPFSGQNAPLGATRSVDGARVAIGTSDLSVAVTDARGIELLVLHDPFKPISELGFVDRDRRVVGLSASWSSPSYVLVWSAPDEVSLPPR